MEVMAASRAVPCAGEISASYGRRLRRLACVGSGKKCTPALKSAVAGTLRVASEDRYGTHQEGHSRKWAVTAVSSSPGVDQRESTSSNARELVDALLSLVGDGSDRGALLAEHDRGQVEQIIRSLEQLCMPQPLKSPLLFGEWDVVYSSNPTATGGYYRSAIGRTLLKTKQMMQIVEEPDSVSNKVSFAALGTLDGEVSLKGKFEALDDKWIKINFDSPELKLGPIKFQYGGTSDVKIAIIYLDERVRLGRGSRGSLFVFKRH